MSDVQPDDRVSVRGEYEATVLGLNESRALLFGDLGTVDSPSGAHPVPIDDLEVLEDGD